MWFEHTLKYYYIAYTVFIWIRKCEICRQKYIFPYINNKNRIIVLYSNNFDNVHVW